MAAFLFGVAVQAQNLNDDLIKPGDVLIVKVWGRWGPLTSRVLLVKQDGSITPAAFSGVKPTDVNVENLGFSDASDRISESYRAADNQAVRVQKLPQIGVGGLRVVVQRGTANQLLNL